MAKYITHEPKSRKELILDEYMFFMDFVKDFAAGLTNFFGGRSNSYEQELIQARYSAVQEMQKHAELMGANAVVGVDIDYEVLGQGGNMIMVTASGTAVVTD